jgi:hypothetical protein
MTDAPTPAPRPVSFVAVIWIFILLSVFGLLARRVYERFGSVAPQNEAADNLPKELAWKATPAARREALADLRAKQAAQASTYAWVDKKAGVVQLPISRAVELVIEEHGGK